MLPCRDVRALKKSFAVSLLRGSEVSFLPGSKGARVRRMGRPNLFRFLAVPQELPSPVHCPYWPYIGPRQAPLPHGVGFEQAGLASHTPGRVC